MLSRKASAQRGFTLIELLIVVAVIGILAAIAIPNLLAAIQRSKQKRTMADMRTVAAAWESYAVDWNFYYNGGFTALGHTIPVSALQVRLEPDYIKGLPRTDGWGADWQLQTNGATQAKEYAIVSSGKDQIFENSWTNGPTTSFSCDIVYTMGSFLTYPQGTQSND